MDLDASLWQWRSGKQSGNHITGGRNTVAIHNHSIIKESCSQESRKGQKEREERETVDRVSATWPFPPKTVKAIVHPSFTHP